MKRFFDFEADFVNSLRCIPMQVRYNLDTCGIKLKLADWNHLNQEERQALVELPCVTEQEVQAYRDYLRNLIFQRTGNYPSELAIELHPAWMQANNIPESVEEKATEYGVNMTVSQWASLSPLERFALIKLSRLGHENKNFPKALEEFKLFNA
ncbi:MAG: nitrate reductase associated protein [Calothrix sp. C42_A2020_038]|nr:nitrate reductase associated protein [Calothrix sp. C42_A2020_038]